ncbi:MAG: DUF1501 domain-containing protein [Tepidisphaerales bacterium]
MAISRRDFIRAGAGALTVGACASQGLAAAPTAARAARALVLIELNGGNDGLNTVIPYADPAYYQARPTLAISPARVLKLSGDTGLHPSMPELADLFHTGRLAIFRGVGHPNPSRSHFTSQQIWHTADPSGATSTGWLAARAPLFYCGPVCPQMFCGVTATPVCLDATAPADLIRSPDLPVPSGTGRDDSFAQRVRPPEFGGTGFQPVVSVLRHTSAAADTGGVPGTRTPNVSYPTTPLAQGLARFAQVITQTDTSAFFHIAQAGFDTHARQADLHASLLQTVSQAIGAFMADLSADGPDRDALVLVFSEFGRRLKENGSVGTDHGEASVVLLAGRGIPGGIHGDAPSLEDLHDGGLRATTDFRTCYAAAMARMVP